MEYLISSLFDAQLLFCFECWLLQFECVYNGQQGQNLWTGDDHLRHHLANVGSDLFIYWQRQNLLGYVCWQVVISDCGGTRWQDICM